MSPGGYILDCNTWALEYMSFCIVLILETGPFSSSIHQFEMTVNVKVEYRLCHLTSEAVFSTDAQPLFRSLRFPLFPPSLPLAGGQLGV